MNNSGTILEAYDFYPFGLVMPGRELSGTTKEKFTGQKRDTETNLDYFGARYYMAALQAETSPLPLGLAKFNIWQVQLFLETVPFLCILFIAQKYIRRQKDD